MFYIVSYDIPDDKRRIKLAKILKDYGDRVQESVFECILDKNLLDKMTKKIDKVINQKEDSVRIYTLCANCEKNIRIMGIGKVTRDEEVYII